MTTERTLRGGSWSFEARLVRCARRAAIYPNYCSVLLGLRPVAKASLPDSLRILRGGSWLLTAQYMRCADRNAIGPSNHNKDLGLRPVAKETS